MDELEKEAARIPRSAQHATAQRRRAEDLRILAWRRAAPIRRLLMPLLGLMLAGCPMHGRQGMEIYPVAPNEYQLKTFAASFEWRPDDPESEATRHEWIAYKMEINNFCPAGYEIIDRKLIVFNRAPAGEVYDVYYRVRCR